jgi:RimJ/RimL family protein N-acetyltransferase
LYAIFRTKQVQIREMKNMLIGKKVRLVAKDKKYIDSLAEIFNDPKINEFDMNHFAAYSKELMERHLEEEAKEGLNDTGSEHFILLDENDEVVGDLNYFMPDRSRDIYIIGISVASSHWSCGYGQDAINTVLEYLFLERNAHKVELMVRETNPRARRCYEKCGFIREAVLRDSCFAGGKPINYLYMGILKDEYLERSEV